MPRLKITVFNFFLVILLVHLLIDWFQLDGADRYYFEISTAFWAGDNFSLIDLIFVISRSVSHSGQ